MNDRMPEFEIVEGPATGIVYAHKRRPDRETPDLCLECKHQVLLVRVSPSNSPCSASGHRQDVLGADPQAEAQEEHIEAADRPQPPGKGAGSRHRDSS